MPANAAASTASVVVPITRLVARINCPEIGAGGPATATGSQLYEQSGGSERSMAGRASGGGIVQNNQGIDRDARIGVDQEWVDVDRGNPKPGIRPQVGEPDERLYGGRLMQRRLAAIALHLDARLGAADQVPGLGLVERRAGKRDILEQFDVD